MPGLKSFSLQKGPSSTFPIVGFSLTTERPEAFLPKMERELKKKAFRGYVLIDTLGCNGFSSRRYFVGEFDGEHLLHTSIRVLPVAQLDDATQRFCQRFYATHSTELSASVLTPAQVFKIKQGAVAEAR
jgi:hypothetical protein